MKPTDKKNQANKTETPAKVGKSDTSNSLLLGVTSEIILRELPAQISGSQLKYLTGFDDAALRNIEREVDGQGLPWIPKAAAGKRLTADTVRGLFRRYEHKLAAAGDLPTSYMSMADMEARLKIPKEFIKWALDNGCPARDGSYRIRPMPILEKLNPLLKKIFGGAGVQIKGIEGLEEWDRDIELAKKLRVEREALEDEAAIRRGDLVRQEVVEELIEEKVLTPARAAILNLTKLVNRQHKTIFAGEGTIEEKLRRASDVVASSVMGVLEKIREPLTKSKGASTEKVIK